MKDDDRLVVGLDIGDGESALASIVIPATGAVPPSPATVFVRHQTGERSIVTAMARSPKYRHDWLIGEDALVTPGCLQFAVNFKHRPDPAALGTPDSVLFGQKLLSEFLHVTDVDREQVIVHIGHPSGWAPAEVEAYGRHLRAGGLDIRLMAESQSALVHVRDRSEGGARPLGRVLVVDIGSSTTDVTIVEQMVPRNLPVGADVGCRRIDDAMFDLVLGGLRQDRNFMRSVETDGGRDLLRLACRRAKEAYFSGTAPRMLALGDRPDHLAPIVDQAFGWLRALDLDQMVNAPDAWSDRFRHLLAEVAGELGEHPELVVLTGGGSRMPFVRRLAAEAFPTAELEDDPEPSFSVARGLASNGRHRVNVERFRADIAGIAQDPKIDEVTDGVLTTIVDDVRSELAALQSQSTALAISRAKSLTKGADSSVAEPYVERLNTGIVELLEPRIIATCSEYGLKTADLRFVTELPKMGDVVRTVIIKAADAPVKTTYYPAAPAFPYEVNSAKWAMGKVNHRPSSAQNDMIATLIVTALKGAVMLWQNRQQKKFVGSAPTEVHETLDLTRLEISGDERLPYVAAIRSMVAARTTALIEPLERFLS